MNIEITDYDLDDYSFLVSSVSFKTDDGRTGSVQLTDCLHKTSLNCEFYDDDFEYTDEEREEIIDQCEDFAIEEKNKYEIKGTLFNCAINNVSAEIFQKGDDVFLVAVDSQPGDYDIKYRVIESFSSLEDCEEYLSDYYTGEYQDCSGLNRLLNGSDEE